MTSEKQIAANYSNVEKSTDLKNLASPATPSHRAYFERVPPGGVVEEQERRWNALVGAEVAR